MVAENDLDMAIRRVNEGSEEDCTAMPSMRIAGLSDGPRGCFFATNEASHVTKADVTLLAHMC
jgi:hypothetical protein